MPEPRAELVMDAAKTDAVLSEVMGERWRQHAKWGQQDLPDGTGKTIYIGTMPAQEQAQVMKRLVADAAVAGTVTFLQVALEELLEANAETDPDRLREELVQVAAVVVQWIEAIDRRPRGG